MSARATGEVPVGPREIAFLLGWKGSGTQTSPAYDTVLKACEKGELRARQNPTATGRKGRWLILPSDAIAWRTGSAAA